MKTLAGMTAFAVATALQAAGSSPLEKGRLLCETDSEPMLAVANQPSASVMIQTGTCHDEKTPTVQIDWSAHIIFDDKGVGNLITGHGHSRVDGKLVGAHTISGGQYIIEMKDGKPVGWRAHGTSHWTAGPHAGRTQSWTAGPTGESSAWIEHETH